MPVRIKRSGGATLVEAAIALPVVLLILLLVVDAFVYMARLGVFNYAVQEAGTMATTVPGLRSQDVGNREAALQQVRGRAWQYASMVLADTARYDQDAGGNAVLVTVAAPEIPIRVELRARYLPLNPLLRVFGEIPLRAQSLVFRDEGLAPGSPLEICKNNADCPCSGGKNGLNRELCSCNPPLTENEHGVCVCPNTCTPPKSVQDPATCLCSCEPRDCGSGFHQDPTTCECKCNSQTCGQFQWWNTSTCQCQCISCGDLEWHCRFDDPNRPRQWDCPNCRCTDDCPPGMGGTNCEDCIDPPTCTGRHIFYEDQCRCECPTRETRGDAYCQNTFERCTYYDYDPNVCACKCRAPFVGAPGSCECPTDYCETVQGKTVRVVERKDGTNCGCLCDCPPPLEPTGPDSCGGGSG